MTWGRYLSDEKPNLLEDSFGDILLHALDGLGIQRSRLTGELGQQSDLLIIGDLLLEEDLLTLSQHDTDQRLDRLSTEVGRRCMKEVLVDVGEHAGGGLKGMVGGLEAGVVGSILIRGMAGEYRGDVEDDRRLLVGQGILRGRLVGKGIEPGEGDLDVILVDGKSQVEQLQLAVVAI